MTQNPENKFSFIYRYPHDDETFLRVIKLFDEVFKGPGPLVASLPKWCQIGRLVRTSNGLMRRIFCFVFLFFCFYIKNRLTYSVLRFSTTIMNLLIRKNNFVCDFFLLEEDKKKDSTMICRCKLIIHICLGKKKNNARIKMKIMVFFLKIFNYNPLKCYKLENIIKM